MYRTLCTLFKNRSLNTRLLYLCTCKFRKKKCDVIYLLSIPELCWWKTTYFSNLNLQNRKGFSTRFASLSHFTTVTLPRVHILECMNQWENKQLFTIFIFENVCNIFRNEINTHCQLFATHYRSSPGNFLISVKKNLGEWF